MNSNSNSNRKLLTTAEILEQMSEMPQRSTTHHRRAHSAINFPSHTGATPVVVSPMTVDNPSIHSKFFENIGGGSSAVGVQGRNVGHRRSGAVDAKASIGGDSIKKVMGADELAELALINPKRARRILANRQSALRSKERKIRYTEQLEREVQRLEKEATTLSTHVTFLQKDTSGLTTANRELELHLQALEEEIKLRDALNEVTRADVERLRIAVGDYPFNQFSSVQQQELNMPQSTNNNQDVTGQSQPNDFNFNQRIL